MRGWRWFGAGASGGAAALLFHPFGASGLVWICLLPLLLSVVVGSCDDAYLKYEEQGLGSEGRLKRLLRFVVRGLRPWWYYFGLGMFAGAVFFVINLSWLREVVPVDSPWLVRWVPTMAVGVFLSVYWGIWALGVAWLAGRLGVSWGASSRGVKVSERLQQKIEARVAERDGGRRRGGLGGKIFSLELVSSVNFALGVSAWWVCLEWMRGWFLTGFGWNGLGVAFAENLYLAQAADLVGVTGLAFMPVLINAVLFETGRRLVREAREGKFRAHLDFIAAVGLVALCFFYGLDRVESLKKADTLSLRTLSIQQNVPQDEKWDSELAARIYEDYRQATEAALTEIAADQEKRLRSGGEIELWRPDWVVWPESALPEPVFSYQRGRSFPQQWNLGYYEQAIAPLGEILGPFTWITGTNQVVLSRGDEGAQEFATEAVYNAIWFVTQTVEDSQFWRKKHLVPFGEYIPFRENFPLLESIFEGVSGQGAGGNFNQGKRMEPIRVRHGTGEIGVVPAICFEDTVARVMRPLVRAGEAQVLLNVTNDGWFHQSAAAEQHFANARFRAIEFRRPLLRVANTGVTGVVSITGSTWDPKHPAEGDRRLLDEDGRPFLAGYLPATIEVPVAGEMTLYARFGDWFAAVCLFVFLVATMIRRKIC